MTIRLLLGDCRDVLRMLPDASVDSIVTDPPYELTGARPGGRTEATRGKVMGGFMGMTWDATGVAFDPETWRAALRVLKPGGHLLAFGGTRTYHRLATAIEDAGFEIRDQIGWAFGSGFPKSHNGPWGGTALKPAWEPICMARKPLVGTVAANVLAHGTGGLNIEGCRVDGGMRPAILPARRASGSNTYRSGLCGSKKVGATITGRWPANLIHDGSDEVLAAFPQAPGQIADVSDTAPSAKTGRVYGPMARAGEPSADSENAGAVGFKMKPGARRGDSGSAARFFYCSKASPSDRGPDNTHPTVKPTDLMRYLCRLVTPPGGVVLDPFMGSGSTLKAAELEGFSAIGIELSAEYIDIARRRITADAPLFAEVEA